MASTKKNISLTEGLYKDNIKQNPPYERKAPAPPSPTPLIKDFSCSIGVGDGTGNLFVHGNYESIKHLQGELLELSDFRKAAGELDNLLKEFNKNTL